MGERGERERSVYKWGGCGEERNSGQVGGSGGSEQGSQGRSEEVGNGGRIQKRQG